MGIAKAPMAALVAQALARAGVSMETIRLGRVDDRSTWDLRPSNPDDAARVDTVMAVFDAEAEDERWRAEQAKARATSDDRISALLAATYELVQHGPTSEKPWTKRQFQAALVRHLKGKGGG